MEEVDKIIILTLNQLGCDLIEEIKSIADFSVSEVITGVTKCLKTINSTADLPNSLPHNMAQRFRAASAIAQAIKDVGYPGDVGYQSLLYPSETDLRKILMFLLEKLPKDTAAVSDEPLNKASLIHQEVKKKLSVALRQAWIPPNCSRVLREYSTHASVTKYGSHHTNPFASKPYFLMECPSKLSPAKKRYYDAYARRVTSLVGRRHFIPSLLNQHAVQLQRDRIIPSLVHEKEAVDVPKMEPLFGKNLSEPSRVLAPVEQHSLLSTFGTSKQLFNTDSVDTQSSASSTTPEVDMTTEDKIEKKREDCLAQCQEEVKDITHKIQDCVSIVADSGSTLSKLEECLKSEDALLEEKSNELKMMQRTASLIPDSETNIQKIQTNINNSEEKMHRLQHQWKAHKEPLDEQLAKLTSDMALKKGSKEQLYAKLSELREKMRGMVQDASRKENLLAQLKGQVENMNRDINRSVYTKRIVDISAKVRKQKDEIDRVLADTRTIQKEINTLSGKLERTFAVVESTAFREAESNERARQVYRAVAAVHEGCGDLVDIIRETGAVQREISDLREQVDLEKSKKVAENLEQLKSDLNQFKKENASLKQQLQ
ncbi:hypothetical protein SK128_000984 [Halocaridina rubra]|uniref:Coiled-coil domain-containing protein 22 homolog n=1 Tax=Halocaridina rubra TaxID=373956 RepID=A0AAN8ZXB8_HALRR